MWPRFGGAFFLPARMAGMPQTQEQLCGAPQQIRRFRW
jgi:hypothetical protein